MRSFRTLSLAAAALSLVAGASLAQGGRGATPPGGPPPGGAQPGRGGGRGRAPMVVMTLTSTAFQQGGTIPVKYSQAGHKEASPPLAWSGADSATSFVLIVHDPATPVGNGTDDMLHWMVWNIPGTARSLPEGVPFGGQMPDGSRQISGTGPYYRGPAAPATGPVHPYVFEIYALDTMLDIPAVGAQPPATRAAVIAAMAGHVRGKGALVGTFRRAAP